MPSSISTEPISVKIMNLIAEYKRRMPPQMAMMKYIGTSTVSQNTKNSRKSSDMNTPSMPTCSNRKNA